MRNLFQFIFRYSFFFVFLIIEILSIYLIIANNSFQRSAFITSSNKVTSGILASVSNVTDYIGLKSENHKLAKENANLRSQLRESNLWNTDSLSTKIDSSKQQFYTFVQAYVISNSFQNRSNYLILNKGVKNGIAVGMGVVSSEGIVGIVNSVSDDFSSVISVLHKKSAIDAKITSNLYTGTCIWIGGDYTKGSLTNIPSHALFSIGDSIVTSGNSSIFPPEIPIGIIDDIVLKQGSNFYNVSFKYIVDYNKINQVYIINNLLKEELVEIKEVRNEQ